MLILAIDAALGPLSLAVLDTTGGTAVTRREPLARGLAERIPGLVAEALGAAGAKVADLDRIVVTTGPGGFTGVRVGIAFARGLALVHGIPLVGVTSFAALAASARPAAAGRPVAVALDDGRGRVLAQSFDAAGAPLGAATTGEPTEAAAQLPPGAALVGSAARLLAAVAGDGHPQLAVEAIDAVALARLGAAMEPAAPPPEPVYLRPADARPPAPNRLLAEPRPEMPRRPAAAPTGGGEQ
jgi:tRNA threonylcarbamoyladenosine biosynthesis protein TsaB